MSRVTDDMWTALNKAEDMIQDCIENPVRSRNHDFHGRQREAYGVLHASGRTLYDSLRTKYDVSHGEAFTAAFERFGFNKAVYI